MRYRLRLYLVVFTAFFNVIALSKSYPSNSNTEARRYYDLGLSYIKSDLYEDGLKTLNQVAFLYPDSDVADDALYQLALIRELAAENEIDIGVQESIEVAREIFNNLAIGIDTSQGVMADISAGLAAYLAGTVAWESAKSKAIVQYILALDYISTLIQRYPESNRLIDAKLKGENILKKVDSLIPKPPPERKPHPEGCLYMLGIFGIVLVLVYISEYFKYH